MGAFDKQNKQIERDSVREPWQWIPEGKGALPERSGWTAFQAKWWVTGEGACQNAVGEDRAEAGRSLEIA